MSYGMFDTQVQLPLVRVNIRPVTRKKQVRMCGIFQIDLLAVLVQPASGMRELTLARRCITLPLVICWDILSHSLNGKESYC